MHCQILRQQLTVCFYGRRGKAVNESLARINVQTLAKCGQILPTNGKTRRQLMSAELFQQITAGSKGVGCGLGNVMKTRDDEPLAGGASAASDFDGVGAAVAPAPAYGTAAPAMQYGAPAAPVYGQPAAPAYVPPAAAPSAAPRINPVTGLPM